MGKSKKPKKKNTIGELTNSRGTWEFNPVTRIKKDKTKYDRKQNKVKRDDY